MPIYIDRHFMEEASRRAIADAHEKDLNLQDKYQVKFLTYWFDEIRNTAFCLVEAPNIEAVHKTHEEAHGGVPSEIIEVDPSIVKSFLGRVADPLPTADEQEPEIDSAFRGIMFTDLKDSTLMTSIHGDKKALHLLHIHNVLTRDTIREYGGTEVKHTGDGLMVSFTSIPQQIDCAIAIQEAFAKYNKENPDELLEVRIGLSAGEPIEEHGDFFGSAVQLAARVCAKADEGEILAADIVYKNREDSSSRFTDAGSAELKGFNRPIKMYKIEKN